MSPSFLDENTPYFFSQRRERSYQQRRLRKTPDDVSVFREWREGYGADGESVVSVGRLSRAPADLQRVRSARRRGSAASSRRVALLPPVDKDGLRLVSGEELDSKQGALASLEEEEKDGKRARSGWAKVKEIYKFNELKFGSTSILSSLGKCLDLTPGENAAPALEQLEPDLVRKFLQDHRSLTSDIVVEKREWQTDCYLDLGSCSKNKNPFLTVPPNQGEGEEGEDKYTVNGEQRRRSEEAAISAISKRYAKRLNPKPISFKDTKKKENATEKRPSKRVTLDKKVMSKPDSPKRPQTAHSTLSNFSFHSDYSRPSSSGGESRPDHYDVLPAELRPPSIMLYKRESLVPQLKAREPRTRLEKYRDQTSSTHRKPTRIKIKSVKIGGEELQGSPKTSATGHRRPSTAIGGHSAAGLSRRLSMPSQTAPAILNFSLTDSDPHDKGWVVHAEETKDPEMATLHIWDRKSKERLRKREEEKMLAKQRNADGPLIVKFYSNPQTRSLRSKHQRSATFPLPAVLSKLPPSVANFTTPGVASGDVMMIGEGAELAVLIMPDGSGHANYHSRGGQRQAVCQSRTHQESRGLYTVAYDDTEANSLLGCFTPQGRGWCYYPGPACTLHMFYDTTELRMCNEDGYITRRSLWANDKASVSIQLNPCLSFHCTGLSNMVLRFSCRGQTYKFNVSPPASLEGLQTVEKTADGGAPTLQSGLEFISDTARAHTQPPSTSPPSTAKPPQKNKKPMKKNQDLGGVVGCSRTVRLAVGEEGEEEVAKQMDIFNLDKTLAHYRDRVRSTVDEWMGHYRQVMGISIPAHLRMSLSHSSSASPGSRLLGSPRRLTSSRSFTGEFVHSRPTSQSARFHTHPLPSRVTSPFGGQRSPRASPDEGESILPLATPIPVTPTLPSVFNSSGPASGERARDERSGGRGKVRRRSSSVPGKSRGCPVCDKRRPPYICDMEYDLFLMSHVSSSQVVVVCVLSSIVEGSCPCEPMLDALHYSFNRQQFSPCTQCTGDPFRLVKYDLNHSLSGTNRTTPLLVERHGVWPGMFMMYVGGRLVYADSVFNGYGTTKKDLLKQVDKCLQEAARGHYIPTDYQFTSHSGGKHPASTCWAYPLSGVLSYLVPYSPSLSTCSSGHKSVNGDDEENQETSLQLSRLSVGLRSGLDLSHSGALSQFS